MKSKVIIKFVIILILLVLLVFLVHTAYTLVVGKMKFESEITNLATINDKKVFSIDKVFLFSSADAINNSDTKASYWNLSIYQYTDIAIYINNQNDVKGYNDENLIKNLSIKNISFIDDDINRSMYYLNPNEFGKSNIVDTNKIDESIDFTVISPEIDIDYSKNQFYNTCNNPITLKYVNMVKEDTLIRDISTPLVYNGSILEKARINLESLNTQIIIDIELTNKLDQVFTYKLKFDIPTENITNGNCTDILELGNSFFRTK